MIEFGIVILLWAVCAYMERKDRRDGRYPRRWN